MIFTIANTNPCDRIHKHIKKMQTHIQTSYRRDFKKIFIKHCAITTPRTSCEAMETSLLQFILLFFVFIIVKLEYYQLTMQS